jgi:hypothetical protein
MLGKTLFHLTGKRLVLYNKHRQSLPVVQSLENRKNYLFIEASWLWRLIPFRATNKNKFRIMALFLTLLGPKIILDINWISSYQTLYKVWTKRNRDSKFVVLQHGSYVGGLVCDAAHRYTKCDVFFTWGPHFTSGFRSYNTGKLVQIINFGNPVFNQFNRGEFSYNFDQRKKILLAPSVIKGKRVTSLISFYEFLIGIGYDVTLKEHKLQPRFGERIAGIPKDNCGIFELLLAKEYDIVITDHSSVLLDAIFFKNRVLIFSDPDSVEEFKNNAFTEYLGNLFNDFVHGSLDYDLYKRIDVNRQEALFNQLIYTSDNRLFI